MTDHLQIHVDGAIGVITIDRPEKLNAISSTIARQLRTAVRHLDADPAVRALLVTATGKAFCVGADLGEVQACDEAGFDAFMAECTQMCDSIFDAKIPTVAAINGYALGGGFEIALSCDIIIAAESASFALPEIELGMIPGWGGTQRLTQLVGRATAMEMVLTGRRISAHDAERVGVANRVVTDGDLLGSATQLTRELAGKAQAAVAAAKDCVRAAGSESGFALEARQARALFATPDGQEGLRAFVSKRPARFS